MELSLLTLGDGMEEVLKGRQSFLLCFIGLPNLSPVHYGVSQFEKVHTINVIYMLNAKQFFPKQYVLTCFC